MSPASPAHAADTLLSQGKTATASSTENAAANAASAAVDGDTGTRWSSAFSDPQWLEVDLGASASIDKVVLNWEAAYGKAYQIQTSADGTNWTSVYSTTTGAGGVETLNVSGTGRYVRMYGTARATGYGYSLWEFQVYGTVGGATSPPTTTPPTTTPPTTPPPTTCGTANAAQGKTATASSTENGGTPASAAVDGDTGTRWSSAASDPQWLQVDLGSSQSICKVVLNWETAYGKAYQIQTSADGANWTTIYSTTTSPGGVETLNVTGTGRYVRVYGTVRATGYGYSLWEFGVYTGGSGGSTTTPPPVTGPPTTDTPDFGPNVTVFDPTMSTTSIQSKLDSVFSQQETNQFGTQRNALLFKPGNYSVSANVGFNTQVSGLGLSPDDVNINGYVTVDAGWFNGNATQNFWREASNLSITPPSGTDTWATAQGTSLRRVDVHGNLKLDPTGDYWASGGFLADSRISGSVNSGSQQQWLTRNSTMGSWNGSVWNMVFVGDTGAPAQNFPNPSHTVVNQTPTSAEVPYLYFDTGSNTYKVFVPGDRTNSAGASWINGTPAGTSLAMHTFYVTKPNDTAETMNAALAAGDNLLVTPGVYHLDQTLQVNRADTVVLGLGMATLVPDNGVTAIQTADVNGIRIGGFLIDAGTTNSNTLVQVGPAGASADHSADPTVLSDIFVRIGGTGVVGKATTSLVINSRNTVGDNFWLWRADHGDNTGWTVNTADTGLVVNGDNVTLYGLAVEHFQKTEVLWNGNGGRTYFFQNEMPYDPPNQAAWMNGSSNGYPAYKVADNVTSHEAWGVGSYCYFNVNPAVVSANAFQAPVTANVKFHDLLTVSLGGTGTITHVINSTGDTANSTTNNVYLPSFP
ncbi:discoidin domain-containing protein [Streptacidiphilus sp. N1-3]|uniref:Discoidin domain-containing protein n=1 Tax=Streptacidiphilus alkalitolerans TaxID=3342712 RepID=A0ABV6WUQ4_9ACTN